jgi:hypothetical protein
MRTIKENEDGLEYNGTHELLFYSDDNLTDENIDIKKNTETVYQMLAMRLV